MTDETEDDEIVCEVDEAEENERLDDVVMFSGAGSTNSGILIFPLGVTKFCADIGAIALRVADKGGDIEYLKDATSSWSTIGKAAGLTRVK